MNDKTNEKKQRLLSLLREMFQLDQPDLDFGLYRIMHAKRGQVEAFLDSEFDQLIDKVFAGRGARQEDEARKVYEAAKQQAAGFGAPDPEAAPMVQQARARYDAIRLTGGEDAEIYDHLYRFFSRYYDQGDFLSLRRYGKGAAGGAETYAIPYDGAEVVLHWANKDQYYIKTTENFSHFSFNPCQALEKDERGVTRQLFDDAATGSKLQVHFRLVEAAEGAHNNVKAGDKDERFFLLDAENPIAWEGKELAIRLHYQPDPDKSGQKGKWQDKRNEQTVQAVLDALTSVGAGHARANLAAQYRAVLAREVPKGKDKKQPLLARYLTRYTASNTMDYFIHKDLGGFLRRELDFYLKNEVLKLDDFVGSEDADVQAGISEARLKALQSALEKAQAIRLLAQRLIDFLAQLENFQKKLWLKKKFVVETQYCITLDRIPEKYYPEIAANEKQREEWVRLFAIDEIHGDLATPGYSAPLTLDFLKANSFLMVDTAWFPKGFKDAVLECLERLDEHTSGILLHSENFHALQLIHQKLKAQVECIYIDPPYNTGGDGFSYKDSYQHSSWATMMSNRLAISRRLLSEYGIITQAIGREELCNLLSVSDEVFGSENRVGDLVWEKGRKNDAKFFSLGHDYMLVYARDFGLMKQRKVVWREEKPGAKEILDEYRRLKKRHGSDLQAIQEGIRLFYNNLPKNHPSLKHRRYNRVDRNGLWRDDNISWPGGSGPKYAVIHPVTKLPCKVPDGGWRFSTVEKFNLYLENEFIQFRGDHTDPPILKRYLNYVSTDFDPDARRQSISESEDGDDENIQVMPSVFYKNQQPTVKKFRDIIGGDLFKNPKDPEVLARLFRYTATPDAIILDFFGGSGTTAHAAIMLNREDSGSRKYILAEMGDHFDSVLKFRIQRIAYSSDWNKGKPAISQGISHCLKYLRVESYEDCLNNLSLNTRGAAVAAHGDENLQRDYLLRYMLDVETQGSQSLLNIAQFREPENYQLEIKKPGSDERVLSRVDLVETFNWLIGLHVEKLHAGRSFSATFVRKPDPLLPEDAHTRLQVETLTPQPPLAGGLLTPSPDKGRVGEGWWFRPVEGYVRTVPGDDRHRQSVLVLWRTLTDDPEQDAAVLEAFLSQQMKFDPNRREDKTLYDVIYINGTHNLPKLGKYGEVRLLEEEFHRRMWAGEEV